MKEFATPTLHRQSNEFDQRNLFFQITLGLLSLAERLEALISREPPELAPTESAAGGAPHPVELVLLGAIAAGHGLRQRLTTVVSTPPHDPPLAVTDVLPPPPDTMRRILT